MIKIVDYGVGNIQAFINIYNKLDIKIERAVSANDLIDAKKIILPGVGHFDYAMDRFTKSGLREKVSELVLEKKIPVLGICVGFQMMAQKSEEGLMPGLGWIDAEVKKFDIRLIKYKTHLPHMGWNDVTPSRPSSLFSGIENEARFYFLHSFYFDTLNKNDCIAKAEYGINFTCAANNNNIYGVQFHPEKSHHFGIQLLQNFSKI